MAGPRLGAHMSIAGGPARALERGQSIGCETIQMFTRNANRWDSRDLTAEEVAAFHVARQTTGIESVVAHSSYLINLGSPDAALWQRSLAALVSELRRCAQLGIEDYVLHPGSHSGTDEEQGLERIAIGLRQALDATSGDRTRIALETTAGQGDGLGYCFEHLAWLLDRLRAPERSGVCLDTAHILAAGYEYRTAETYAALWAQFDETIGLEHLRAIHLNDSKKDLDSHVDRHEQIGQGCVGIEAFRLLMNDSALRHVPMILETPKGEDMAEDVVNLTLLRSLIAA